MEGRYFKKSFGDYIVRYEAIDNNGLNISFNLEEDVTIKTESRIDEEWYLKEGYETIDRTEFMEAYLPIAEKMNNKIGEL